jgi:hypothetical protein
MLQIDINNLENTGENVSNLSSTNGAGGILDVFYGEWKLRLNEHSKVVSVITSLWKMSYCAAHPAFKSPFGQFDHNTPLAYIDRICFRLPEFIVNSFGGSKRHRLQRSLTPHLDCCPQDVCEAIKSGSHHQLQMKKWRPIQAFIALTDTIHPDEGGFEACPGLHKRFETWANYRLPSLRMASSDATSQPPCVGAFTPIRPIEDRDIIMRFEHIPCRAGDMVCWDYRIPHSNSRFNNKSEPREVVYVGFLPNILINRAYVQQQLSDFTVGRNPSDQWVGSSPDGKEHGRVNEDTELTFSTLGQKLFGMVPWN